VTGCLTALKDIGVADAHALRKVSVRARFPPGGGGYGNLWRLELAANASSDQMLRRTNAGSSYWVI
jgi:hypothetical protein